jgi:hypothetical protein
METYKVSYMTRVGPASSKAIDVEDLCHRENCGNKLSSQGKIMMIVCSVPGEIDTFRPICKDCEESILRDLSRVEKRSLLLHRNPIKIKN